MKNKISHHPHDKLVATMLKDTSIVTDLLKNHLPKKQLAKLDLSTLRASSETAVSPEWKKYHSDIVFCCKTKKKKDVYIYVLIEHLSNPYKFMPIFLLRYTMNLLGKQLDAQKKPDKLPNFISLVIYHGQQEYPYETDIFSCFEDEELAKNSFQDPMILLDLAKMSEKELLSKEGSDAVLKMLLKYSRHKDFIRKVQEMMKKYQLIFVPLSQEQAKCVFEYVLHVGKGNPKNAISMRESFNETYGPKKADKIFSLADYFQQQGMQQGRKDAQNTIKALTKEGKMPQEYADIFLQALKEKEK